MKKLYSIFISLTLVLNLQAQAPDKMSYQAVVRNSFNELITNTSVGVRISVLQGAANGTSVYTEAHISSTNDNGLFSIEIGNGITSDNFSAINWADGVYYLKTEIDPDGGSTYTITGTTQLLSVPFAKYADKAGNTFSGSYNDLSNIPVNIDTDNTDDFDGAYSNLTGAPTNVSSFTNDAGYLTAEVDGSTTNELELPTQTGNSGKYLTTNGSSVSWADVASSGLKFVSTSSSITLTTEDQFVVISGAITITLPASPRSGQTVKMLTDDNQAVIHLNGGTVNQNGTDYTTNDTFQTYGNSYTRELIYFGTKWYVLY